MTKEYIRSHWCDQCGVAFKYPPPRVHEAQAGTVWVFCKADCYTRWLAKRAAIVAGQGRTPEELVSYARAIAFSLTAIVGIFAAAVMADWIRWFLAR